MDKQHRHTYTWCNSLVRDNEMHVLFLWCTSALAAVECHVVVVDDVVLDFQDAVMSASMACQQKFRTHVLLTNGLTVTLAGKT